MLCFGALMGTFLPDKIGIVVDQYGNAEFSRDVLAAFPSLRSDLLDNANLLHPQMGTLGSAVRASLADGDAGSALRICEFLEDVLGKPNAISEMENAVALSFVAMCELRASNAGRELLQGLPARVRTILLAQERRDGAL